MPDFIDQINRIVSINEPVSRIISLVPSQTELLHHLELNDEVIGITKFCIHPNEWFREKTKVGGTKKLNIALIHQLQPDLILANKEENTKQEIEELSKSYPVWISDVNDLGDAYEMIKQVGNLVGKTKAAEELVETIQNRFSQIPSFVSMPSACYLIWRNPYMTVGGDTFIHSMLTAAGFQNVFEDQQRYPVIEIEVIKKKDPEFIFLSTEPFPFNQQHVDELIEHCPTASIFLVDGEIFSWYGSRMLNAPAYFLNLRQHGLH